MGIVERWLALALLSFVVLCICGIGMVAQAHDHEHPELNEWYMGLHAKGGAWCCDGNDAVTVDEWATKDGHYIARVEGEWISIPDDAVVEGPNRAMQAKIWPKHMDGHPEARCFIPGALG